MRERPVPEAGVVSESKSVLRSHLAAAAPLVSVIIPTRDRVGMLAEAIEAVLSQDLDDHVELIIIDDASTDGTQRYMRDLIARVGRPIVYVRSINRLGPAEARNRGLAVARGRFIAFTDSDCIPANSWLRFALAAFDDSAIGVVQGRTVPEGHGPLFEHHIAIDRFDGTFATCNVVYRREALRTQRFDPGCWYWEDVDLGWRIVADGWRARYAPDAVVAHKVIRISPSQWITWSRRYVALPAITARHPGYRRHLFLGVWVRPVHLWFDLALVGVGLGAWQPAALALAVPYAIVFARTRGLRGRFPPAKLAAYVARDLVSFLSLGAASARHRRLVL
jgi:glycosyltransferase involved in cell wall biosynthesis